MLETLDKVANLANIYYIRQKETRGLGDAVLRAKEFVGTEPFAVLYGDDVIMNDEYPVVKQLCDAYEKYGKGVCGVQAVSEEAIQRYCTLAVDHIEDNRYYVSDMIEKPTKDQILSYYSILGRLVLTPEIYSVLEKTPLGAGDELQLTDAMKTVAQTERMVAVDFVGKRYDMGNKLGVMQAQVETALKHPEIGADFREYLKEIAKTL